MARNQTRRTISLEQQLHGLATQRAAVLKRSTSHYISELIRHDLVAAGIEVPAAPMHADLSDRPAKPPKHPMRPPLPSKPPKPEPPTCWWCRKGFATHETAVVIRDRGTFHAKCARVSGQAL